MQPEGTLKKIRTLEVIHYTPEKNFQLRDILIRNGYRGDGLPCKPLGGLWTCPRATKDSWKKWCKGEYSPDPLSDHTSILLTIRTDTMLTISTEKDLQKLPTVTLSPSFPMLWIDFESIVKRNIQSIHLTDKGQWATRYSHPLSLYGWDCESVLILNKESVLNWRKL